MTDRTECNCEQALALKARVAELEAELREQVPRSVPPPAPVAVIERRILNDLHALLIDDGSPYIDAMELCDGWLDAIAERDGEL